MKSFRIQAVSSILGGLISLPAHAEVIPGRWEKVEVLETASPITVELKNGDRIVGRFRGLFASGRFRADPFSRRGIEEKEVFRDDGNGNDLSGPDRGVGSRGDAKPLSSVGRAVDEFLASPVFHQLGPQPDVPGGGDSRRLGTEAEDDG